MTPIGEEFPVRAKTLSRIAQKRASRPARSPASTQCLDILCPPPGTSEVISHFERLSSNEMKMAPICVWIAAGSTCGSRDIGSLQSESDRNLSLPHDRPLSTPHGIFGALATTESGEAIAAHSPGGDALLIGAGRDNGRFCAYIF